MRVDTYCALPPALLLMGKNGLRCMNNSNKSLKAEKD